jgi:hypothetical protein
MLVDDFSKIGTVHTKVVLFRQKSVLFIRNLVKKLNSFRSDFFQSVKFLNTGLNLVINQQNSNPNLNFLTRPPTSQGGLNEFRTEQASAHFIVLSPPSPRRNPGLLPVAREEYLCSQTGQNGHYFDLFDLSRAQDFQATEDTPIRRFKVLSQILVP